jgi:enoyl-CoA hydratase
VQEQAVTVERRGHVLLMGLNRPQTRNPFNLAMIDQWTTPVVAAVHGSWLTLTIELLLAADIRIAADNARFAQLEIKRGLYPFGGATVRLPQEAG